MKLCLSPYKKKILDKLNVAEYKLDSLERVSKTYRFHKKLWDFIGRRENENIPYDDFLELKQSFYTYTKIGSKQTLKKYICYYRYKGKKLYREYCKNKTRNWDHSSEAQRAKSIKSRSKFTKEDFRRNSCRCIEFWVHRGYSEEEARAEVKRVQGNTSLKSFQKRYGKELGYQKWLERNEKWQNTLKSKPQEEIDDINRRKSSGLGNTYRNQPCKLYYIRFYNDDIEFWKIGITIHSIEKRFDEPDVFLSKYNLKYDIEFINEYTTVTQAYHQEQYILSSFNDKRITTDYNGFYTTETFSENVLKEYYENNV